MKWNDEKGYLVFQSSYNNIKSLLGISVIDLVEKCEFMPYYTYILDYLSKRLLLLVDSSLISKIQEVFDVFEFGTEKIAASATLDLAWDLDIETSDIFLEGREIPYNQEYLVFSWSGLFTSLCTRLKLQYSHLLHQPDNHECHCCNNGCSVGLTTSDLESWTSNVYPEDEEYSIYSVLSSNNPWRTETSDTNCTKCLRNN